MKAVYVLLVCLPFLFANNVVEAYHRMNQNERASGKIFFVSTFMCFLTIFFISDLLSEIYVDFFFISILKQFHFFLVIFLFMMFFVFVIFIWLRYAIVVCIPRDSLSSMLRRNLYQWKASIVTYARVQESYASSNVGSLLCQHILWQWKFL